MTVESVSLKYLRPRLERTWTYIIKPFSFESRFLCSMLNQNALVFKSPKVSIYNKVNLVTIRVRRLFSATIN